MTLTCLPLRAFEAAKVRVRTGTPVKARHQGSPSWSSWWSHDYGAFAADDGDYDEQMMVNTRTPNTSWWWSSLSELLHGNHRLDNLAHLDQHNDLDQQDHHAEYHLSFVKVDQAGRHSAERAEGGEGRHHHRHLNEDVADDLNDDVNVVVECDEQVEEGEEVEHRHQHPPQQVTKQWWQVIND